MSDDGGWAGGGFDEAFRTGGDSPGPADRDQMLKDAADTFLTAVGLDPNPDAIDQLVEAFLPALRIICERDHAGDGSTWKKAGWKPQLHELFKKMDRLHYRDWLRSIPDPDSAIDIINYAGFYLRGRDQDTVIKPWGSWGEPDSAN